MPTTYVDGKPQPQGCECTRTNHQKHPGTVCLAQENLYAMIYEKNGKLGLLWFCLSCHGFLCNEPKDALGRVPI